MPNMMDENTGDPNETVNLNDVCVISVIPAADKHVAMETDSDNDEFGGYTENADGQTDFMEYYVEGDGSINGNNNNVDLYESEESGKNQTATEISNGGDSGKTREKRGKVGRSSRWMKSGNLVETGGLNEEVGNKKGKSKVSSGKRTERVGEMSDVVTEFSENVDPNEESVEIHIVRNSAGEYVLQRADGADKGQVQVTLPENLEEETMYNLQMLGEVALQEQTKK